MSEREADLYHEIMRAITEMQLLPGRKLTEDKLARAFQVSRARVRKVLLYLADDGIVTHEPNKGAFVREPSPEEARQIIEARLLIETHLASLASGNGSKQQYEDLRAILDAESQALVRNDAAAAARLSGEFHLGVAKISGHQLLLDILHPLISRSSLVIVRYRQPDAPTCSEGDHQRILELLMAGKTKKLVQMLTEHFGHFTSELDYTRTTEPQSLVEVLAAKRS